MANVQPNHCNTLFSSSDEDATLIKDIKATHDATNCLKIDVKPILRAVKTIIARSSADILTGELDLGDLGRSFPEYVFDVIHKISCEMSCNSQQGGVIIVAIFKLLSNCQWEAKLAIALAAFALKYAEVSLVIEHHSSEELITNKRHTSVLAQWVVLVKQLPDLSESKHCISLIETLLELTGNMVSIFEHAQELKAEIAKIYEITQDLKTETSAMSMVEFPLYAYWFIKGVAFCTGFISNKEPSMLVSELDILTAKIGSGRKKFESQLRISYQQYVSQSLLRLSKTKTGSEKIIMKLIYSDGDQLFDCSSGKSVDVEVLREKDVFLFISNLNISDVELEILKDKFKNLRDKKDPEYVIVWLPISSLDKVEVSKYQQKWSWYMVQRPLSPEAWVLEEEPVLVVFDRRRKIECLNALHMARIWGSEAIPFTKPKERELWAKESWNLELLFKEVDPDTLNKKKELDLICLYGGVNEEWIQKFTEQAKKIVGDETALIYVGKGNCRKEELEIYLKKFNKIEAWKDFKTVQLFWTRLNSMWHLIEQIDQTVEMNRILKQTKTLLAFDGSAEGWALFGTKRGSKTAKATGDAIIKTLSMCNAEQIEDIKTNGVPALNKIIPTSATHCHRIELLGTNIKTLACPECDRPMKKYTTFKCCDGTEAPPATSPPTPDK